jgi:hypothetical protein
MGKIKGRKFTVEESIAEKNAKAQKRTEDLKSLMNVTVEEWVKGVQETRREF